MNDSDRYVGKYRFSRELASRVISSIPIFFCARDSTNPIISAAIFRPRVLELLGLLQSVVPVLRNRLSTGPHPAALLVLEPLHPLTLHPVRRVLFVNPLNLALVFSCSGTPKIFGALWRTAIWAVFHL
jgi:hypothetical protein